MTAVTELQDFLAALDSILLGYSGGVDSALLGVAARKALGGDRFLAVIGRSPSYPANQYRRALDIARRFDLPLLELDTHELEHPEYRANRPDRCYHCKHELWSRLATVAAERGFATIIDGTNADDVGEHRPGLRAAAEHGIRSPLADLGWTKARVRQAARELEVPIWDAPASPCLSSRIQYGLEVTAERLGQVEAAEQLLRASGVTGDLRVRHRGDCASVEVDPATHAWLRERWGGIAGSLAALGFARVDLDPRGYRRGGLLNELPVLER